MCIVVVVLCVLLSSYVYCCCYVCIAVLTIDAGLLAISQCLKCVIFLRRLIAKKVCAASSRTSYRIVPLTNLNKYLHVTLVNRKRI